MFAGTLKTFSITSLIQVCYNDSSSGTIAFSREKAVVGKIGFENGSIVYADFLGTKGIDAVRQLALLEKLDFKFDERIILPEKNINVDINFLLIDCSKCKDEAREYIDKIGAMFSIKYNTDHVIIYEYRHSFFSCPEIFNIKYFEAFDGRNFMVVYLDKNIHARIELLFEKKILTNDLLMFMKSKDILQ
ncbi:MAG: DUF4388 domain-containing protein [Desulfobacula sp.]|uniref:DUF4388 domain-containing protein n=1 Tax=Desulfobacula sp. TaxID=2593537 RepID=UPI0025B8E2F8|nr:DUF4388 domain-containing protein [Desulfobacula sp.]MCD4721511.1 DUF4388 domain-containing protein [Desulfobacula sp.]